MNSLMRDVFGERIGRIANEHLTTGTGSGQPNGILTASTQGASSAASASIDFDDVIDLVHGVDPAYRNMPSVRFMFHDNILKALRKVKDSNNNYIWQPGDVRSGAAATILGYPYEVNQDMTSTITTGDKTMLFGAFEKYVVRRVQNFQMLRLVERYADYLQVGFIGFARLDGELVDTAAVKHLVQS
jgi:HK97 family phage major capsid protein